MLNKSETTGDFAALVGRGPSPGCLHTAPGCLHTAPGCLHTAPGCLHTAPERGSVPGHTLPARAASPGNGPADTHIHGTTVIAVKYRDGVINIGDRRATGGFAIMYDQAEKILALDDYTLIAISGSFSKAMEVVRYLRHAFKYYERSQLQPMSLDGKLSELGRLIAGNMMAAMNGIGAFIPVLSTYDRDQRAARIFFYDAGGARFETVDFGAAGSGSTQIRGAFEYIAKVKGPFHEMDRDTALREALTLLEIAADLDAATGGSSKILPVARTISAEGIADIEPGTLRAIIKEINGSEPHAL